MAHKGSKNTRHNSNLKSPKNSLSIDLYFDENGGLSKNGSIANSGIQGVVEQGLSSIRPSEVTKGLIGINNPLCNGSLTIKAVEEIKKQIWFLQRKMILLRVKVVICFLKNHGRK